MDSSYAYPEILDKIHTARVQGVSRSRLWIAVTLDVLRRNQSPADAIPNPGFLEHHRPVAATEHHQLTPMAVKGNGWILRIGRRRDRKWRPAPEGPVSRGYYATIAELVFTVGLAIAVQNPALAGELVAELP